MSRRIHVARRAGAVLGAGQGVGFREHIDYGHNCDTVGALLVSLWIGERVNVRRSFAICASMGFDERDRYYDFCSTFEMSWDKSAGCLAA